ncbi:nucleotide sugar dehydrogenase [Candidatus Pelagibacter sp.]|nr:nucleotide sugar dehydrogenase [Candidatus Pelagibacter sp.]
MINNKLYDLIKKKKSTIGIFGLGYIGLPRTIQFLNAGYRVIGFDKDNDKIKKLKKGISYLSNVNLKSIKKNYKKNFFCTTNPGYVAKVDVIIFCLPTPLTKQYKPDLSYIKSTLKNIFPYLKKNQAICLESTTYPGTTEEVIYPVLKKKFDIGKNFYLIYSPERDDPGNNIKNFYVPRLVSGKTKKCLIIGRAIYNKIFQKLIPTSDTQTAEITKLFENVFRSINIGLVNEMKKICYKMNMNIHEIINAASTKPYGYFKFLPGPGLGGHCIPIDPFYLSWKAKKFNLDAKFIRLAGRINRSMPTWVISKISDFFKKKGKSLNNKKVLILGVAYKKNINDTRESPAFEIIKILKHKYKAVVEYHDPFVPIVKNLRNHRLSMRSIKLSSKKIKEFDVVILVTNHDIFDFKSFQRYSRLLVDTRGIIKNISSNVLSL